MTSFRRFAESIAIDRQGVDDVRIVTTRSKSESSEFALFERNLVRRSLHHVPARSNCVR